MLRGAVGVDRLDRRQRSDQVDRRDAVGNAIGEQITRLGLGVPLTRFIKVVWQENPPGPVGVGIEPDEVDSLVFRMLVPETVLSHRQAQSAAYPSAVRGHDSRLVEKLVGKIEVRELRRAAAVMAVIAAKNEIRAVELASSLDLLHHLADQHVGPRDRPAGGAELAAAKVVM